MHKIVHMTSVHTPYDTRIFVKQCRSLAKKGYQVSLIAPHFADEVIEGVRILAVPKMKGRVRRIIRTVFRVAQRAWSEQADLYHIHDPELIPVGLLLRWSGRRVVFDMHENLPMAIQTKCWIPKFLRGLMSRLAGLIERLLLHRMPVIFAELSYHKNYRWIQNYAFILNAPCLEEITTTNERFEKPTIGYIGGIVPNRGSLSVLESLALLRSEGLQVSCEYVGPVSETHRAELTAIAAKTGLDGFRLWGYLPSKKGLEIISRCHIGIAVLKPIPNYFESFPTKVAEYMALGIPVIVSNFPLYREMVESVRCGICVDPNDPNELAQAITWLLDHPDQAEAMGKRGQQAVYQTYNWETQAKALVEFYQELLGENSHNSRCQAPVHQSRDCQPSPREVA